MSTRIKTKKRIEALRRIDSLESLDDNIWLQDDVCTNCGTASPPYQLHCSLQCRNEDNTSVGLSDLALQSLSSVKKADDPSTRLRYAWPPLTKMRLTATTLQALNEQTNSSIKGPISDSAPSRSSGSSSSSSDSLSDGDQDSPCTSLYTLQEVSKDQQPPNHNLPPSYLSFHLPDSSSRGNLRRVSKSFNLVTELQTSKTTSQPRGPSFKKVERSPSYPGEGSSRPATINFARRPSNTNLPSTVSVVAPTSSFFKRKQFPRRGSAAYSISSPQNVPIRSRSSSILLSPKSGAAQLYSEATKIKQVYLSSLQSSTKTKVNLANPSDDLDRAREKKTPAQAAFSRHLNNEKETSPRGRSRVRGDRSSLQRSSSPPRADSRRRRSEEPLHLSAPSDPHFKYSRLLQSFPLYQYNADAK